jgi:hypothetical protein
MKRYTLSVMMSMLYGQHAGSLKDPMAAVLVESLAKFNKIMRPGETPPIGLIPALKYIPERWASWKTRAREVRGLQSKFAFTMMDTCEKRVQEGKANEGYIDAIIQRKADLGLTDEQLA